MNLINLGSREIGQVFMATPPSGSPVTELLLDCGASKHMFANRSTFIRYTPLASGKMIKVGDGRPVPVVGHGTVSWRSQLPDGF